MKKTLFLAAAAAALALTAAAGAADAAVLVDNGGTTWTTALNWAPNGQTGNYGLVTLQEVDPNNVKVTVTLAQGVSFADNGNGHVMFGFNLQDSPESTVTWLDTSAFPQADVVYSSSATADNTPGNSDFANSPFGHYDNAWDISSAHGVPNTLPSSFVFNVYNSGGITFAGLGATYDAGTGQLLTFGSGNRFFSNSDGSVTDPTQGTKTGGWWFSADTSGTIGSGCSPTCAIAGRDAFAIPEPATWALMILGVGGMGALLRRRRAMALA